MIGQNKEDITTNHKKSLYDFLQDSNAVRNALKIIALILGAIILGIYIILAMILAIKEPQQSHDILYELTVVVIIGAVTAGFMQITFIAKNLIFNEQKRGQGITIITFSFVVFALLVLALVDNDVIHLIFGSLKDFMSSNEI